jgi:hypothetical protein
VLGHDFSGVVVETPYAAHPLSPGDAVYGMAPCPRSGGSYAEYISVPSLSVARKPAALSHLEAAAVPLAALTAWGMVVDVAKAHEGQRLLINAGAGGVGHFAVQFASYFGAHVVATGSQGNSAWLRELGAAEVVDYGAADVDRSVRQVDVVINLVATTSRPIGRSGCSAPEGSPSTRRSPRAPPSPRRPRRQASGRPGSPSPPTGPRWRSSHDCSTRVTSGSTSTRSTTWPTPATPTRASSGRTPGASSCCASPTTPRPPDPAPGPDAVARRRYS